MEQLFLYISVSLFYHEIYNKKYNTYRPLIAYISLCT